MSDLICENYPMVLVMSRFGIDLGFGEKNIGDVCRQNEVDSCTFLTVVNFLTEETPATINGRYPGFSRFERAGYGRLG